MNHWIKCSNRLPIDGELVLVWRVSKFTPKYESCAIAQYIDNEFDLLAASHFKVTHWMPLPKCPVDK